MKRDISLLFFRLSLAVMMLTHGYPKLIMLLEGKGGAWLDPLGIGSTFSLVLCVGAEFFASLAILVGFLTRPASLILAVNCWVIFFVFYADAAWASRELPGLYLICYLSLMGLGAGRFSVDHCLMSKVFKKEHLCAST